MPQSTEKSPEADAPSDRIRARLLDAILALAGEEGWTKAAMDRAGKAAGLSEGEVELAAPNGVRDLMEAHSRRVAKAVHDGLVAADLTGIKIREKVRRGVLAYLAELEPHKAAVKRASGSPLGAANGPTSLWQAADAIWSGLGDTSTDGNWYSKRLILSGVIGSTTLVWLGADDREAVESFLDRRIENVMQFEKAKAETKQGFEKTVDSLAQIFPGFGGKRPDGGEGAGQS